MHSGRSPMMARSFTRIRFSVIVAAAAAWAALCPASAGAQDTNAAAGGSSQSRADAGRRTNAWQATDCVRFKVRTDDDQVECGYVSVPRRHADPTGPAIRLATVIIKSQASEPSPEPLFIAQGGPGGSSIDSFAQLLVSEPAVRPAADRDLIVWDQRGTLFSEPALTCPEMSKEDLQTAQTKAPDKGDDEAAELAAYRACGERLAREAGNLSDFNTVENANDIEAIRIALGYDAMTFYGVSYGSELGQYLIRQHPEHLRAAVLDAVVPTTFSLITDVGEVKLRIGEKYFAACSQEPSCNKAYPNLGLRFLSLIDRLNKKPVELT